MRKKYIDMLRELALFYMFFQHAVLALLKTTSNRGFIFYIFEAVPVCSALFLFLSGYSLMLSYDNKKKLKNSSFIKNKINKSLLLMISGEILFILENGFQFPDFLISPNILFSIGLMILFSLFFLNISYKKTFLSALIIILILLTFILEYYKIFILPFNSGYEPWSPTIIFGFIGLLTAMVEKDFREKNKPEKIFILFLGLTGIFILLFLYFHSGIYNALSSEKGRYTIERIFNRRFYLTSLLDKNNIFYSVSIWNFSLKSFFASLAFIFTFYAAGYFSENILNKFLPKNIFIPGKYALFNYFFHLGFIGIIFLIFGENSFGIYSFIIFLTVLFTASYLASFLYDHLQKKITMAFHR